MRFVEPPAVRKVPSFALPRQLLTRRSSLRCSLSNPRLMKRILFIIAIIACLDSGQAADNQNARKQITDIVSKIQRADYEGDRETLRKCYDALTPFLDNKELAPRIRYWRGFDLWRSAINGFNDKVDERELERL